MRTKIYNILFSLTLLTMFSLFIVSCDKEDYTGYSTMKPSSPTISITPGFTSPVALVENDAKYEYTVTLSEPQLVDVHLSVAQIDGTASASDFEMTTSIVIVAGETSGKGSIKIFSDEIIEDVETLKIQIGDVTTANASLTPVIVEFSINNLTANDLSVGMSCSTDAETAVGMDLTADQVVDLRLLVVDKDGNVVITQDNGYASESITMLDGDFADGEYYIAVDLGATINAGDFNAPITLDLDFEFNQIGVINGSSLSFPGVMTNEYPCDAYRTNLVKITKSGTTYSIEKAVSYVTPERIPWFGVDTESEYASKVETVMGCEYLIFGLCKEWMTDFWGEEIVAEGNVSFTVDDAGNISIPSQYIYTTLYDGAEFEYSISGTGTIDETGDFPVMIITYSMYNSTDGYDVGALCVEYEYMANAQYTAYLTLDPKGIAGKAGLKDKVTLTKNIKPKH